MPIELGILIAIAGLVFSWRAYEIGYIQGYDDHLKDKPHRIFD